MPDSPPPRRLARAARPAIFAFCLLLGGCSWLGLGDDIPDDAKCPAARVEPALSSLTRFGNTGTTVKDVAYHATISDLSGVCDFKSPTLVSMDIQLRVAADRGPRGTDGAQSFPYFIAILDPKGTIVSKHDYTPPITFKPGETSAHSLESLTVAIPIADPLDAAKYEIVAGLQLTPNELQFNRAAGVGR